MDRYKVEEGIVSDVTNHPIYDTEDCRVIATADRQSDADKIVAALNLHNAWEKAMTTPV